MVLKQETHAQRQQLVYCKNVNPYTALILKFVKKCRQFRSTALLCRSKLLQLDGNSSGCFFT